MTPTHRVVGMSLQALDGRNMLTDTRRSEHRHSHPIVGSCSQTPDGRNRVTEHLQKHPTVGTE